MDPESVYQITKAITSLHDGRAWKPETWVATGAALVAAASAWVTFMLGKRQIKSAQDIAQKQISAAEKNARTSLVMPMREAWIGQLRAKISWYLGTCMNLFYKMSASRGEDMRQVSIVRQEIKLMLDAEESQHEELDKALYGLVKVAVVQEGDEAALERFRADAIRLSRALLRSEWQRAKAGD